MGLTPYGSIEPSESADVPAHDAAGMTFSEARKTLHFWILSLSRFSTMFTFQVVTVYVYPHIVSLGIAEITAALVISIIGISGTISRLLISTIADRIGPKLTLFLSVIILTTAFTTLFFSRELWHFYIFAVLFGMAWGGIGMSQILITANIFGPKSLGTIIGSMEFILAMGGAIGVYIAGIIFDATGSYNVTFLICIGQALVLTICSYILIRSKNSEEF